LRYLFKLYSKPCGPPRNPLVRAMRMHFTLPAMEPQPVPALTVVRQDSLHLLPIGW